MMTILQYLHPFDSRQYAEAASAVRIIGRDCIQRRITALERGDQVPNDILTHILRSARTLAIVPVSSCYVLICPIQKSMTQWTLRYWWMTLQPSTLLVSLSVATCVYVNKIVDVEQVKKQQGTYWCLQ